MSFIFFFHRLIKKLEHTWKALVHDGVSLASFFFSHTATVVQKPICVYVLFLFFVSILLKYFSLNFNQSIFLKEEMCSDVQESIITDLLSNKKASLHLFLSLRHHLPDRISPVSKVPLDSLSSVKHTHLQPHNYLMCVTVADENECSSDTLCYLQVARLHDGLHTCYSQ